MTERVAFVLRLKPSRADDYVAAHTNVWPEMLKALRDAGIRNYTIFRDGNQVFGYYEADDVQAAEYLDSQPVSARWQDAMAGLLETRVPNAGPPALDPIFRLE